MKENQQIQQAPIQEEYGLINLTQVNTAENGKFLRNIVEI